MFLCYILLTLNCILPKATTLYLPDEEHSWDSTNIYSTLEKSLIEANKSIDLLKNYPDHQALHNNDGESIFLEETEDKTKSEDIINVRDLTEADTVSAAVEKSLESAVRKVEENTDSENVNYIPEKSPMIVELKAPNAEKFLTSQALVNKSENIAERLMDSEAVQEFSEALEHLQSIIPQNKIVIELIPDDPLGNHEISASDLEEKIRSEVEDETFEQPYDSTVIETLENIPHPEVREVLAQDLLSFEEPNDAVLLRKYSESEAKNLNVENESTIKNKEDGDIEAKSTLSRMEDLLEKNYNQILEEIIVSSVANSDDEKQILTETLEETFHPSLDFTTIRTDEVKLNVPESANDPVQNGETVEIISHSPGEEKLIVFDETTLAPSESLKHNSEEQKLIDFDTAKITPLEFPVSGSEAEKLITFDEAKIPPFEFPTINSRMTNLISFDASKLPPLEFPIHESKGMKIIKFDATKFPPFEFPVQASEKVKILNFQPNKIPPFEFPTHNTDQIRIIDHDSSIFPPLQFPTQESKGIRIINHDPSKFSPLEVTAESVPTQKLDSLDALRYPLLHNSEELLIKNVDQTETPLPEFSAESVEALKMVDISRENVHSPSEFSTQNSEVAEVSDYITSNLNPLDNPRLSEISSFEPSAISPNEFPASNQIIESFPSEGDLNPGKSNSANDSYKLLEEKQTVTSLTEESATETYLKSLVFENAAENELILNPDIVIDDIKEVVDIGKSDILIENESKNDDSDGLRAESSEIVSTIFESPEIQLKEEIESSDKELLIRSEIIEPNFEALEIVDFTKTSDNSIPIPTSRPNDKQITENFENVSNFESGSHEELVKKLGAVLNVLKSNMKDETDENLGKANNFDEVKSIKLENMNEIAESTSKDVRFFGVQPPKKITTAGPIEITQPEIKISYPNSPSLSSDSDESLEEYESQSEYWNIFPTLRPKYTTEKNLIETSDWNHFATEYHDRNAYMYKQHIKKLEEFDDQDSSESHEDSNELNVKTVDRIDQIQNTNNFAVSHIDSSPVVYDDGYKTKNHIQSTFHNLIGANNVNSVLPKTHSSTVHGPQKFQIPFEPQRITKEVSEIVNHIKEQISTMLSKVETKMTTEIPTITSNFPTTQLHHRIPDCLSGLFDRNLIFHVHKIENPEKYSSKSSEKSNIDNDSNESNEDDDFYQLFAIQRQENKKRSSESGRALSSDFFEGLEETFDFMGEPHTSVVFSDEPLDEMRSLVDDNNENKKSDEFTGIPTLSTISNNDNDGSDNTDAIQAQATTLKSIETQSLSPQDIETLELELTLPEITEELVERKIMTDINEAIQESENANDEVMIKTENIKSTPEIRTTTHAETDEDSTDFLETIVQAAELTTQLSQQINSFRASNETNNDLSSKDSKIVAAKNIHAMVTSNLGETTNVVGIFMITTGILLIILSAAFVIWVRAKRRSEFIGNTIENEATVEAVQEKTESVQEKTELSK